MVEQNKNNEGFLEEISEPEMVQSLIETVGERVASLIVLRDVEGEEKVINVAELNEIISGERKLTPEVQQRLKTAYQVTLMLKITEAPGTIKAWFIGSDPLLDDKSPALEIATNPQGVIKAAKAFMAE